MQFEDLSHAVYHLDQLIYRDASVSEPNPSDTSALAATLRRVHAYCQYALEVGRAAQTRQAKWLRRSHHDHEQLALEVRNNVLVWPIKDAALKMLGGAAWVLELCEVAAEPFNREDVTRLAGRRLSSQT